MTAKILFVKTIYSIAGLLIMASIGFNIYQYQRNNKLSQISVPKKITKNKSTRDYDPVPEFREEKNKTGGIDKLVSNLNAAEEELNIASKKLSEELTQKAEFRKADDKLGKSRIVKKTQVETLKSILNSYDPLKEKLDMSKEEFDAFKGILAERMDEIQDTILPNINAASDEEKADMNMKRTEINNRYWEKINNFLGEEKSRIYLSYQQREPERSSINALMEMVPPESRISEEKTESLIDSMYDARKAIYDEMGPDINIYSSSELTEESIIHEMEKTNRVHDKYLEASRSILPAEQVELYEAYLNKLRDFSESMMKTRIFMNNN